ncbi:MAG: amidohydrolase [Actinotalea sp.]|nr:amidohydrolase [Actinotalea sp.]
MTADDGATAGRGVRTAFVGGTVWAGQGAHDAEALVVSGDTVAALGRAAADLVGQCDEVVDLAGGFLMPAFGDGHAHPMFAGLQDQGPAVADLTRVEDVVSAVRTWAQDHPAAAWVVGAGYDPALAAGGEFDARWLDAAVPDRPVVLRASDYHTVWCNTAALRASGVDASTPDPPLGEIVRRADGSPLGTLREWHAVDLVLDRAPAWSVADQVAALRRAGEAMAAAGITWVQDAWVDPWMVDGYLAAARAGALRVRTNLALRADPDRWREQLPWFEAVRDGVAALGHPLLAARTVKFFADGVIESGTAAMLEPYADAAHRGMPVWDADELAAAAVAVDALGLQLHVHAIGDAAVRNALDAVQRCRETNGARDRRPVLTHLQLVDRADLPRLAELDVVANVELLWAQPDAVQTELTRPRLGARRSAEQYRYASMVRSGVHVSAGSDWPVTPHDPLPAVQVAVTRSSPGTQDAWLPHECLEVEEALHACTAEVAYQAFADDARGRLRVGGTADLVLLDADPRRVPPTAIGDVAVRGTWLAGSRIA